jgi:drug/metabolite transporter (DMT)-like permease
VGQLNKSRDIFARNYVLIPLALFACFLWGSAFPSIKAGYEVFSIGAKDTPSQLLFAGLRFTLAGIMVISISSLMSRKFLYPKRKELGSVLIISLFQTVIQYLFFYIGLANASGVSSSIIESTNVFIALLVAVFIFRQESLSAMKIAGCILGFAGVCVINIQGGSGTGDGFSLTGEGFILISTVGYGISSSLIKNYGRKINPVMISGWQFFFGGLILSLAGLAGGGRMGEFSPKGGLLLFYLAFISAAAYTIWSILLKYNPVSKMSVIGLTNPVFGVVLSALILGETAKAFNIKSLGALILITLGIICVNRRERDINKAKPQVK